jgi:hypothetical protein
MITSAQALKRYGDPRTNEAKHMVVLNVPSDLLIGTVPRRIYCNRDLVMPLLQAFTNLRDRGLSDELKTWDGCFNIRNKRTGSTLSLHSWGLGVDANAAWNRLGKPPTLSPEFVKCWTDAGFDWGGHWKHPDGMHFQLAEFPK